MRAVALAAVVVAGPYMILFLPCLTELNEFRVITGSVCKQPRVMAEATA